ncbi:MAG: bifunctional adenosylcobinamide kinase/adenosylcobinamide-phosphate guanylyltransferase [Lachnospiraceae bacterium]|nr:bifunctional adenosylcobinamide kinase/adenosylcobinamide-phosphate guanylyltransferase [Lachnospiraceae bacterium]
MLTVITGGSGSGKSAFAEKYVTEIAGESRKYYLATMQVFDREGQEKVDRHRQLRSGKGFHTIEQPTAIYEALEKMRAMEREEAVRTPAGEAEPDRAALLECMSNLAANEMFSGELTRTGEETADKILREVEQLSRGLQHLVIVTNNVFEDGVTYDASTMEYIRGLGSINAGLAAMADEVIEVVAGIPLPVKGGR